MTYSSTGKFVFQVTTREDGERRTHIADATSEENAYFLTAAANFFSVGGNPSVRYIENALVTLSPSWHGDKIAKHRFMQGMNGAIAAANALDQIKKTLFYGRDNNLIAEGQQPLGDNVLSNMGDGNASPSVIVHGVIGIFTEAGELLEMLREAYNGNGFDPINMREEIGDLFWYVAILLFEASKDSEDSDGYTFEACMRTNIEKLRTRFPKAFTEAEAINRDLAAERRVLEDERIAAPGLAGAMGATVLAKTPGLGGLHEAITGSFHGQPYNEPPLIVPTAPASGAPAVARAAEASAKAFDNVGNVEPAPATAPTSDLGGELAKGPAERLALLPQEGRAKANAGEFDCLCGDSSVYLADCPVHGEKVY